MLKQTSFYNSVTLFYKRMMVRMGVAHSFVLLFHETRFIMFTLIPLCWLILQSITIPTSEAIPAIVPEANGIIFSSSDGGHTWQDLGKGLPADVTAFNFHVEGSELYLGGIDGLFRGVAVLPIQAWRKEHSSLRDITGIFPGKDGPYVTRYGKDFYQYILSSGFMQPLHTALSDKALHAVHETKSGVLCAAGETGMYRSADRGKTWAHVQALGSNYRIIEAEGVMLATGSRGLWRSTDDGEHWSRVQVSAESLLRILHLPEGFVAILEGQEFGGIRMPNMVFLSTDLGKTWQTMNLSLSGDLAGIYDLARVGPNLFACSHKGIFRSEDGGATWQQVLKTPADKGGFFRILVEGQTLYSLFANGC